MARNSWHHPYKISIVGAYLYAKDLYQSKYQLLIKKRESTGLKYFDDSKLNPIVNELFIGGRKLNFSFAFITQSRLNSTHYFVMKIQYKN